MKRQRIDTLAEELGLDAHDLTDAIHDLTLGLEHATLATELSPSQVLHVRHQLGYDPSIGVWRLTSLHRHGASVLSGQTHLVIHDDVLWEVWPHSTYYDDQPAPTHTYDLVWDELIGQLTVHNKDRPHRCALMRLEEGEALRIRWGQVDGHFPDSLDDDGGTLAKFRREDDPDLAARLDDPPATRPRPMVAHDDWGVLRFDANLGWWECSVDFMEHATRIHIDGPRKVSTALLDRAAHIFASLSGEDITHFAATRLLARGNDQWDGLTIVNPRLFQAWMTPESIGIHGDGSVSVFFDGGDLFAGHVIIVALDEALTLQDAQVV